MVLSNFDFVNFGQNALKLTEDSLGADVKLGIKRFLNDLQLSNSVMYFVKPTIESVSRCNSVVEFTCYS